jgi:S-disulfanyl-L-cysteine oxidoreductase SoxD
MFRFSNWAPACTGVTMLLTASIAVAGPYPGIGRTATPAEIKAWDIDVRPDFKGLPPGSGSVAQGQKIWDAKCASCHGTFGESNEVFTPLVGGTTPEDIRTGRAKALVTGEVARTTLMKLATISTLWDYIHRAMPWTAPKSLSADEVYAVVAYLLNLGDILPDDFVLTDRNIAEVQQRLPNRNGMTRNHGLGSIKGKPDVANVACMKDCLTEAQPGSALPDHARGSHGNLADQTRGVGPVRGMDTASNSGVRGDDTNLPELARRKACLSCHTIDKRVVGPAFRDVAARYKGAAGVEERLVEKLRKGGGGAWGPLPMPPNPDLAESDARALIRWILAGAV